MRKIIKSLFNKNGETINHVGFTKRSELKTNIPITDFLDKNKDFIWKCALNFPKLKFEEINFRNHGKKKYLNIDKDTKLFFSFFKPCAYADSSEWWKYVSSTHICLVYKDNPVVTLKCTTTNDQRQIMIEYSEVVLPFIDNQEEICGQFGAGYDGRDHSVNDIDFYYKYNKYISKDELMSIMDKFVDILKSVYDSNKELLDSSKNFEEVENKVPTQDELKESNLENAKSFLNKNN